MSDANITGLKRGIALIDPTEIGAPALLRQARKGDLRFVHWAYPRYCVEKGQIYPEPESRNIGLQFVRLPDGTPWSFHFAADGEENTKELKTKFKVCKYIVVYGNVLMLNYG